MKQPNRDKEIWDLPYIRMPEGRFFLGIVAGEFALQPGCSVKFRTFLLIVVSRRGILWRGDLMEERWWQC